MKYDNILYNNILYGNILHDFSLHFTSAFNNTTKAWLKCKLWRNILHVDFPREFCKNPQFTDIADNLNHNFYVTVYKSYNVSV